MVEGTLVILGGMFPPSSTSGQHRTISLVIRLGRILLFVYKPATRMNVRGFPNRERREGFRTHRLSSTLLDTDKQEPAILMGERRHVLRIVLRF